MWQIYEKKQIAKQWHKIPIEIKKRYEVWKRIVELNGSAGLRAVVGYHDEALKGEWKGFRSSRLNIQWRVIYKVEKQALAIYVIDVMPHTY